MRWFMKYINTLVIVSFLIKKGAKSDESSNHCYYLPPLKSAPVERLLYIHDAGYGEQKL
jgi:hypothetical protein